MNKLIYFSAPWCQPCKKFGPIMDRIAQTGIPVQKIDVDQDRGSALEYRIRSVPTVVKVDSKGRILDKHIGVASEEKIRKFYNG